MCLLTPVKGEYSNARRLDAYHTNALVCKESKSPASLILQDKHFSQSQAVPDPWQMSRVGSASGCILSNLETLTPDSGQTPVSHLKPLLFSSGFQVLLRGPALPKLQHSASSDLAMTESLAMHLAHNRRPTC